MLTKTGKLIIFTTFILYVIGMQSSFSLIFLILGIILGMFGINFFEARVSCQSIHIAHPESINCFEGESLIHSWKISNRATCNVGHVSINGHFGILFNIERIKPKTIIYKTPILSFLRRGVFSFSDLFVESTYPFGLIKIRKRLNLSGEILVYPKPYSCQCPVIGGFEPVLDGCITGKNFSRSGDNFRGVRPLRSADPIRLVHWRSSAKGLGLMVKEFDETLSGRLGLILDSYDDGNSEESLLDWAARATASLMLRALVEGHQVEYVSVDERKLLSVSPFSSGEVVLESLARMDAAKHLPTSQQLMETIALLPVKSSICFVLTNYNPEVIDFIHKELMPGKRKVVVYLPDTHKEFLSNIHVPVKFYGADQISEVTEESC